MLAPVLKLDLIPIPDTEGYFAGSDGRVYSIVRQGWRDTWKVERYTDEPKRLRGAIGKKTGYLYVTLTEPAVRRFTVHHLICSTFHGPRPPGTQCSHLNGCGTDNRPGNLAWETPAANSARRVEHGTLAHGERQGLSRLNTESVKAIRHCRRRGVTVALLARLHGVDRATIRRAAIGETWSHVET